MGNICGKELPDVSCTCINTGKVSTCCMGNTTIRDYPDYTERSTYHEMETGGSIAYSWRYLPMDYNNPQASAIYCKRSFPSFMECKQNAIDDLVDNNYHHATLVICKFDWKKADSHQTVYESEVRLDFESLV